MAQGRFSLADLDTPGPASAPLGRFSAQDLAEPPIPVTAAEMSSHKPAPALPQQFDPDTGTFQPQPIRALGDAAAWEGRRMAEGVGQIARGVSGAPGGIPVQSGIPGLTVSVPTTVPTAANAASDIIEGGMRVGEPAMAVAAVTNPITTALALGAGMAGQRVAEAGAEKIGASPEVSRFAGNVGAIVAGGVGGKGGHVLEGAGKTYLGARRVAGQLERTLATAPASMEPRLVRKPAPPVPLREEAVQAPPEPTRAVAPPEPRPPIDAPQAPPVAPPAGRFTAADVVEPTAPLAGLTSRGNPIDQAIETRMPVADIQADPQRFQFKQDTDAAGVREADRLAGTWDPNKGGVLHVWRDPADGQTYVVNGHHRLELAKRAGQPDVVARFIEAPDAQSAMRVGAEINISEGRGSAVDAAKLYRSLPPEERQAATLDVRTGVARDGQALANLSDSTFHQVATGEMPLARGVAIGQAALDPSGEAALLKLVAAQEQRGRSVGEATVRELANEVKAAPTVDVTGTGPQRSIFEDVLGDETKANLAFERADIRAKLRDQLGKDARLFGFVAKEGRAEKLAEAGKTRIDVAAAGQRATDASRMTEVFDRLATTKGPINDAITTAAEALAKGARYRDVAGALYDQVRSGVDAELRGAASRVSAGPPDAALDEGGRGAGPQGSAAGAPAGGTPPEGRVAPPVVDITPAGAQPRLPGDVGAVRDREIPTPELDAPFSLGRDSSKAEPAERELFNEPAVQQTREAKAPQALQQAGTAVLKTSGDIVTTHAGAGAKGRSATHQFKGIIRANAAEQARRSVTANVALHQAEIALDKLPDPERLGFINRMETGQKQADPAMQPIADTLRTMLDQKRRAVQRLGKLHTFIEDYFPHIWKQKDTPWFGVGKRPLEGSKAFLKKRTVPTIAEGIEAGLTPIDTNPVRLVLLKMAEMDKWLMAHDVLREGKQQGIIKFVRSGADAPEGWIPVKDPIGTVWKDPNIAIWEGYDQNMMNGLLAFAKSIGAKVETAITIPGHPKAAGVARTPAAWLATKGRQLAGSAPAGEASIIRKFGSPETVVTHEIGHVLDEKLGLHASFKASEKKMLDEGYSGPFLERELRELADLRYEGAPNVPKAFKDYVRMDEEKMANVVHAYVHAPELMRAVAPRTWDLFTQFIDDHPQLEALERIKPSLVLGSNESTVNAGGPVLAGKYYAPAAAAKALERYLSSGLAGKSQVYDAYRWVGNNLNQVQLGISGFHAGTSAINAVCSKVALALEHAAEGRILPALKAGVEAPVAWLTDAFRGGKAIRAYEQSGGPGAKVLSDEVYRIVQAGGRVRMDYNYRNQSLQRFLSSARQADWWGAAKSVAPAAIEAAAKPIMEHYVPRLKVAAFLDLASKEMDRLGPNASIQDVRSVLGGAWDSIDNRFGQLVYDNLFANKVLKDLGMASVRSLGWNLGTVREHGQGFADLFTRLNPKTRERIVTRDTPITLKGESTIERTTETMRDPYLSHATGYFIGMSFTVGMMGALYQYAHTGEWPTEARDYFFPKTGGFDRSGRDERISFPSYMKDLSAFSGHPFKTVGHKVHPLINLALTLFNNEDYFGSQVRNPDDSYLQQAGDVSKYVGEQYVPISFRSFKQREEADPSWTARLEGTVGIAPAPASVKRSAAESMILDYAGAPHRTKAEAEAADARRTLREAVRKGDETGKREAMATGLISRGSAQRVGREAHRDYIQGGFSRLTLDEALHVWDVATPDERAILKPDLSKKFANTMRDVAPRDRIELTRRYRAARVLEVGTARPRVPVPLRASR